MTSLATKRRARQYRGNWGGAAAHAAVLGLVSACVGFAAHAWWVTPVAACWAAMSAEDQDFCVHDQIVGGSVLAPEAIALAGAISDPLIRGAAVMTWLRANRLTVGRADAFALCGLLALEEEKTCVRLSAAQHLQ